MFVDLVFKFCCSKRQKPDQQETLSKQPSDIRQNSQINTNEPQKITFTAYIDTQRQMSSGSAQEIRMVLETHQKNDQQLQTDNKTDQQQRNSGVQDNKRLVTSIENNLQYQNNQLENSTDKYLNLGDAQPNIIGSFEEVKVSSKMQIEIQNQDNLAQTLYIQTNGFQNNHQQPTLKRSASTQTFEQDHHQLKKKIRKEREKPQKQQQQQSTAIRQVKIWDRTEDELLIKYYKETAGDWHQIAQRIPGRNMNQCAQRYRRLNPKENSKMKLTKEDDSEIISLVEKHGKNWMEICKSFPGRTGKQIRERYLNKLDPKLNSSMWTKEEDQIILDTWRAEGPKWTFIANKLPGRSENMVKNRFYSYIRRVILGQKSNYQIVLNPNTLNNQDISNTGQVESPFRVEPYSEKGSYTSGTENFSSYQEEEMEFLPDEDDNEFNENFAQNCNLKSEMNGHDESSQNFYLE